ncbi:MAG TPA: PadR family transcriptional regulator [Candidatus Acidoferrales bacterium]|nr:PadR family transcriptional regulator [Candidatus Acidoferrales bacterium]
MPRHRIWKEWAHDQFLGISQFGPLRMERGNIRFFVLMTLRTRPLHGYGIIKAIEDVSGHAPSAGVIYPTLQMLEDEGCVTMNEEDHKKIYVITDKGRRFLEDHRVTVERLSSQAAQPRWSSLPGVGRRVGEIARTVFSNYSYLDDEKILEIERILDEARKQISEVIFARKR